MQRRGEKYGGREKWAQGSKAQIAQGLFRDGPGSKTSTDELLIKDERWTNYEKCLRMGWERGRYESGRKVTPSEFNRPTNFESRMMNALIFRDGILSATQLYVRFTCSPWHVLFSIHEDTGTRVSNGAFKNASFEDGRHRSLLRVLHLNVEK